jgi:plasmid stability protein
MNTGAHMKVLTVRLPDDIEKRIRIKAKLEHRTLSEQIKKILFDGMVADENSDLPISFINSTLEGREEINEGMGEEYTFGIID